VLDMKAGLVQLLLALRGLIAEPDAPALTVVINADEELGSPDSAPVILREATRCRCALVLEPSGPGGALKTRRKGMGLYRIEVTGAAAHPGLDFASGVSATVELSRQVLAAAALTNGGSTVNVGVVGGGTGRNVVAARAFAELETRFWSIEDGERLDHRLRTLTAVDPRAELTLTGGIHRMPLSRASSGALAELAVKCAHADGWELGEVAVGGVSDGNLTAAADLSTLDGLGAVGGGAHSDDEYVLLDQLPVRAALLRGLLLAIARK
jgi:glutamate carboxypeptidase